MVDPLWILVGFSIGIFIGSVSLFVFGEPIMRMLDRLYKWFPWNRS